MPNDPNEDLIDLSALDPFASGTGIDARASAIARDAMDARRRALARRFVERTSIASTLIDWSIPTLLAAGLVFAVALSTVARVRTSSAAVRSVSAADAMGIPRRLTDLLRSPTTPSLVDLGVALDGTSAP
ncbi:MAG TPA: hypothetical protein VJO33_02825 [Gemmatimonadaceae bacterium]|nr:hypothetical protein [Gemmatimonadaceae bacterium]